MSPHLPKINLAYATESTPVITGLIGLFGKVENRLQGGRSNCFRIFSNYLRFWYQKKTHFFLITCGEFYSWKMYHLEDIINENVTSYGNHK